MPKGLSIDTLLPTPTGWTSVHALKVGDWLFDEAGYPCRVTEVSDPFIGESLAVSIGWGKKKSAEVEKMVVGTEQEFISITHLKMDRWKRPYNLSKTALPGFDLSIFPVDWVDWSLTDVPKTARNRPTKSPTLAQPVSATKANETTIYRHHKGSGNFTDYLNHHIPCTQPLKLPDRYLPIDPYIMGLLIQNWNYTNKASWGRRAKTPDTFGCTREFFAYYEREFALKGWKLVPDVSVKGQIGDGKSRVLDCKIEGMVEILTEFGFKFGENNHIPPVYLRGSVHQREELLAGLLDQHTPDFFPVKSRFTASYCARNPRIKREILELVRSLGYPAFVREWPTKGEMYKPNYILWRPLKTPFKYKKWQTRYLWTRMVGSDLMRYVWRFYKFEDNGDAMMRTIAVDSKFGMFSASEFFLPVLGGKN